MDDQLRRRTPRGGPGRRPHRGREQRPVGHPGDAGGDRGARRRRPRPARRRSSRSSTQCASTSACLARCPGERALRPVRFERSRVSWRPGCTGPGQVVRRAPEHRDGREPAAGPGPQGQEAPGSGRPGRRRRDLAGSPRSGTADRRLCRRAVPPGTRPSRTDHACATGRVRRARVRRPPGRRTTTSTSSPAPPPRPWLPAGPPGPRRLGGIAFFGGRFVYDEISSRLGPAPDYPGPGTGHRALRGDSGATSADIGRELKSKGVVKSVDAFNEAARKNDKSRNIQVGYYQLKKQMKASDALGRPGQPRQPDPEPRRRARGRPRAPDREDDRRQDRHLQEGRHRGAGQPEGDRPAAGGQGQPRGLPVPRHLHRPAEADRASA